MKTPLLLVGLSLALGTTLPALAAAPALETHASRAAREQVDDAEGSDRLIVKYRDQRSAQTAALGALTIEAVSSRQDVQISPLRRTASGAQVYKLDRRLGQAGMQALLAALRQGDADIEYAEPDRILQALATPADPMYSQQWSLFDATGGIRAPAAWDRSRGAGVTVAVIDTGVRPHADLVANLLPGYDFISDAARAGDSNGRDGDAADPGDAATAGQCGTGSAAQNSSWHGTHVAGIIAAVSNTTGVVGVAYQAKILPLRALGRCGGYTSDIADAILWAAGKTVSGVPANANPAKVINLSLGGTGSCDSTTQNAINTARAAGSVVVVAAGNSATDASTATPANCAGVITVAATAQAGGRASYSNYGAKVTLAAPGGDRGAGILSTYNSGLTTPGADSYAQLMGTSMATPVVSGVAALMLSANKGLTPDQVASLLKSSARAFPAACSGCGVGLVDASAAVAAALGTSATPAPAPQPTPTPTPTPSPTPAPITVNEVEPNDTVAKAQVIASVPATVNGSIATTADTDHFRVSVPAGKTLTATLTAGSASGFGLGAYSTSGQQLVLVNGVVGAQVQLKVSNGGGAAAELVLRVLRTSGATGSYKLNLAL